MLDSSKTGYLLRPGTLEQDSKEFNRRPFCFDPKGFPPKPNSPFILDVIKAHVQQFADDLLNEYKRREPKPTTGNDPMFQEWMSLTSSLNAPRSTLPEDKIVAKKNQEFLLLVKRHVHVSWVEWNDATRKDRAGKGSLTDYEMVQKEKQRRRAPETSKQDITDKAARLYAAPLPEPADPEARYNPMHLMLVNRIKAYIAYCEDMRYPNELRVKRSPSDSFAFCVAFTQLCTMQAERSPTGYASSVRMLDEMRGIGGAGRKVLDAL